MSAPPALTYDGGPCAICGGTLRYSSNQNCVPCARARRQRLPQAGRRPPAASREIARATGRGRYLGEPCPQCGSCERYTSDGKCAPCRAAYMRDYKASRYHPAADDEVAGMAYARATVALFRGSGWRVVVRRAGEQMGLGL